MALQWPPKDPNEVLDYAVNWASRLGADTIATSSFTVPSGIVKDSETSASQTATIWLSGGVEGQKYSILNRITTVGGRTMDQTVKIKIKSK